METIKTPRMRTVKEAAQELKALDSHTAVTEYHIRRLALQGVLPKVKAGKKILINLDTLIEYLQNPTAEKFRVAATQKVNGVRPIV
ncbi:MAG: helix-turn-helix domain-containing protein [Ruminococcus sp.]|nr:helix-turn-helix domain-containing protein [Ruminococcus sp.]